MIMKVYDGVITNDKNYLEVGLAYLVYLFKNEKKHNLNKLNLDSIQTIFKRDYLNKEDTVVKKFYNKIFDLLLYGEEVRDIFNYSLEDLESLIIDYIPDDDLNLVSTPKPVIALANRLLELEDGDRVVDLCSGWGTYLIDTAKENNVLLTGYDYDSSLVAILKIKGNVLNNINKKTIVVKEKNILTEEVEGVFDKVFMHPPLGVKKFEALNLVKDNSTKLINIDQELYDYADWLFIKKVADNLQDGAKAVVLVNNASIANVKDKLIRKELVESKKIEAVLMLTENLMRGLSKNLFLLVLKNNSEKIKFVDASTMYSSTRRERYLSDENIDCIMNIYEKETSLSFWASIDEIKKHEYTFSPARYLFSPNFEDGVNLGRIVNIRRGTMINAASLDQATSKDSSSYCYLRINDINEGIINQNLKSLDVGFVYDKGLNKYVTKPGDIILSKNSAPFKIAVVEEREKSIIVSGNIYILEVDKGVADPYYIQAFFQSEVGQRLLEVNSAGVLFPTISLSSLKEIKIPLPSLEKQVQIGSEFKRDLDEIITLKEKLGKLINKTSSYFEM